MLVSSVLISCLSLISMARAQKILPDEKETYTRPAPRQPMKPEIPDADRSNTEVVFLEYADSLFRPPFDLLNKQIVKGNVKFRQGDMWVFCDSAYYYPDRNSMDAFGHVRLVEGDTLEVKADKAFYNGIDRRAWLVAGPSCPEVELRDSRGRLYTDSLNYDSYAQIGWYETGGRLVDDVNTLTSVYGEYSTASKQARFRDDVVVVNTDEKFTLYTGLLDYNTNTRIADISTATRIEGENDTIITTSGWYDTERALAELTSRSTILHSDSSRNVITLEGDSIIYDGMTHISRVYMFRNPAKLPRPMVLNDTARKIQLIGGYGEYNDSTQFALSTHYPLLIEYSRPDTLFLRADTVKTELYTVREWPDSLKHGWDAATRTRLRSYSGPEEMGREIKLSLLNIPAGFAVPGWGLVQEADENTMPTPTVIGDSTQLANTVINDSTLTAQTDLPLAVIPTEITGDTIQVLDELGRNPADMIDVPYHRAEAIGMARFFNQDIQGIADTIRFNQIDSLLHLIRKPIVWSEEKQIFGDSIIVHLNDTTADWALLPVGGMVAEHIDEDFYNQLSGSMIKALLEDKGLRHLEVEGNVEAIILPMENDSTYNRMVTAESSYLTVDMEKGEMKELKMWPEVTGTVTPIYQVKRSEQFLPKFKWYEYLRPRRAWYEGRLHWDDELGEVPDELIQYFK